MRASYESTTINRQYKKSNIVKTSWLYTRLKEGNLLHKISKVLLKMLAFTQRIGTTYVSNYKVYSLTKKQNKAQ